MPRNLSSTDGEESLRSRTQVPELFVLHSQHGAVPSPLIELPDGCVRTSLPQRGGCLPDRRQKGKSRKVGKGM